MLSDLIEVIAEETGKPAVMITVETRLDHLGIDSLDFIDLMLVIGKKFKEIPESKYASIDTVGDIAKAIA